MAWARAGIVLAAAALAAGLVVSGGTAEDPPIPRGLPGVIPAFMSGAERGVDGADPRRGGGRWAVARQDRRWLQQARPLGGATPRWAQRMYRRSLLVLRASVAGNGAAVAGARPGWAYVWPRDAGAVAIAFASAGYRAEARRIASFLLELDLDAAARFERSGRPVEGRAAQGDAAGWVAVAARAAQLSARPAPHDWRDRADYQEGDPGDYLANALASIASGAPIPAQRRERRTGSASDGLRKFVADVGLMRIAGDPESGLDTTAAWAVRPFPRPALYPAVRRTLRRLVAGRETRFGLLPSQRWDGGDDPWTAPTAWSAWALAALARHAGDAGDHAAARRDRRTAIVLLGDLRRTSTPLGLLPERVDAGTGLPTSTTPLAWSHAFAILAIRELWPQRIRH